MWLTLRVDPIDSNNQQLNLVSNRLLTARDRVMPRLDLRNQTNKLFDTRSGTLEHFQNIGKSDGDVLGQSLEQLGTLRSRDELESHSFGLGGGNLAESSVERFARSTKEINVLLQELEDGSSLESTLPGR